MIIYWAMLAVAGLAALADFRPEVARRAGGEAGWVLTWAALTLIIGFRFEVGPDWVSYLRIHNYAARIDLIDAIGYSDPGYTVVNWISARLGWGIYGVNLFCGAVFSAGLIAFCRTLPRPALALAVAVPSLVIVAAMGYSRQGTAIGLALFALIALSRKRPLRFVMWILFASLFHRSAVILLPLVAMVTGRGRIWSIAGIIIMLGLLYTTWIADRADLYVQRYVVARNYSSEGALIRVVMNAAPAVLFLLLRRRFALEPQTERLWTWMSLLSLVTLGALAVSPSTTIVDRVALYLVPIQLFVFASLPGVIRSERTAALPIIAAIIGGYGLVLGVWLTMAENATAWLPYRFAPFMG